MAEEKVLSKEEKQKPVNPYAPKRITKASDVPDGELTCENLVPQGMAAASRKKAVKDAGTPERRQSIDIITELGRMELGVWRRLADMAIEQKYGDPTLIERVTAASKADTDRTQDLDIYARTVILEGRHLDKNWVGFKLM